MKTDYSGVGKIQYLLGQRGLHITDSVYTDVAQVETLVEQQGLEELKEAVTEGTSGRTVFLKEEPVCFAFLDGNPIFF